MSIKNWVFGEVRYCGYRKCCKQFVDLAGRKGQAQLYCCSSHQNTERQAVYREKHRNRAVA